jgi:DNA polymerase II small subunit/DNA polymerase delta subunit B
VGTIRAAGGLKASDDIMVHLLKMRHLAPTHGSTMYIPDEVEDALTIEKVPDIFVTGHIHRAQSKSYRNVTCINSSSWGEITDYQEKRGIEPQPARAFIVSLKTRDVKVMNFGSGEDATTVSELNKQKSTKKENSLKNTSSQSTSST